MKLPPLPSDIQRQLDDAAETMEIAAPPVSDVPALRKRFARAYHVLMVHTAVRGVRAVHHPDLGPRTRAAVASYDAVARAEGISLDNPEAVRVWLRGWMNALHADFAGPDEGLRMHLAALSPSVRDRTHSMDALLRLPADQQVPQLFAGLIRREEMLEEARRNPLPPPSPSPAIPMPRRWSIGAFVPPEEPTYEGRLRLYAAKGGSRALAARYTAELLHQPSETVNPATPKPADRPKGDSGSKTASPAPPLAA